MPYIELEEKEVGDPLVKEWVNRIRENFRDHENRLNQSETTGGTVFILNQEFKLAGFTQHDPFIRYFKAVQDFNLSEFMAQIFQKGLSTSGILALDLQKSTDTNNANFNSVLTEDLSFNYGVDADFSEKVGSFNSSLTNVSAGEVLRIEVKSIPPNFGGKVLLVIGAE